jgi:AcrR family transcriptional regulator
MPAWARRVHRSYRGKFNNETYSIGIVSSQSTTAASSAGRPRSEEAHRAILDAALELLVEVGYSGLTVEGIASRAGVGKATIYRRWASKLPLVMEAFGDLPGLEESDTGDLVTDLERMLRHNPELMELFAPLVLSRRQPLIRALERGVARGEIPPDTDLSLAADLIVGPITVRLFFSRAKPTPKLVPAIVRLALEGIRAR